MSGSESENCPSDKQVDETTLTTTSDTSAVTLLDIQTRVAEPPRKKQKTQEESPEKHVDEVKEEPPEQPIDQVKEEPTEQLIEKVKEEPTKKLIDEVKEEPQEKLADEDKERPDGVGLATVVAKHYNELEEKGLAARTQSKIYYMRNFNNWIKSMSINDIVGRFRNRGMQNLKILDMCCGKGGDILKWVKTNMTDHVVFVDIAETSVKQCEERYRHTAGNGSMSNRHNQRRRDEVFTAEFYTADCTKERLKDKYSDPDIRFDLVSVQFSFHYCFESLPQAEMMLQNISENLKPGGFFIGTTPNADLIMKKIAETDNKEFGNNIFRIQYEGGNSDKPFPLFGAKYYFQLDDVVNCPEFLVSFDCLERLAAKHSMKLLFKHTFDEFFAMKEPEGHVLLDRMQALETYPQFHGEELSSDNPDDYVDAKAHMDEARHCRRIGTLSKSEWAAVSLYVVFAFEKVE